MRFHAVVFEFVSMSKLTLLVVCDDLGDGTDLGFQALRTDHKNVTIDVAQFPHPYVNVQEEFSDTVGQSVLLLTC